MITAKVITHSRPAWAENNANDIISIELEYPRFILAELNTHRVFSRSTASSRAIPTARLIDRVRNTPVYPAEWGRNQPGMSAAHQISDGAKSRAIHAWNLAAHDAANNAEILLQLGIHKQVVNRLLEPFLTVKTIVTSTEWDNFFALRDSENAQPEMRLLAQAMRRAIDESMPRRLEPGEWHTPFMLPGVDTMEDRLATSVAGCARVSYESHTDECRTLEADRKLYQRLVTNRHMSPFEHQATPIDEEMRCIGGFTHNDGNDLWSGNFRMWAQYRHVLEWENEPKRPQV